jgi:hypothetical protein
MPRRSRRKFRVADHPACSRSAEVTASKPTSRWLSPMKPTASIASGATAPV